MSHRFVCAVAAGTGKGCIDVLDARMQVGDDQRDGTLLHHQGQLAQSLLRLLPVRDVARDDDEMLVLTRLGCLARDGELKPCLSLCFECQLNDLAM